jgi:hypothetical protein
MSYLRPVEHTLYTLLIHYTLYSGTVNMSYLRPVEHSLYTHYTLTIHSLYTVYKVL